MTEAAMRQVLDKTRKFAERQRLLKELWRAQGAASAKEKENEKEAGRTANQAGRAQKYAGLEP